MDSLFFDKNNFYQFGFKSDPYGRAVEPEDTRHTKTVSEKVDNVEFLGMTNEAAYEMEQRWVPKYTGEIRGFRIPDTVQKYRQNVISGNVGKGFSHGCAQAEVNNQNNRKLLRPWNEDI